MVTVYPMLMKNQFHPMNLDKDDEELIELQINMMKIKIQSMNVY